MTIIGKKVTLKPGRYEVIGYDETGPYHSDETKIIQEPTGGLVMTDVWEGAWSYNVLIYDEDGTEIIVNAEENQTGGWQ